MGNAEFKIVVGRVWDAIVDPMPGVSAQIGDLKDDWIAALASGADIRRLDRLIQDRLLSSDWQWPWFDEWRETFRARRLWPQKWRFIALAESRINADFPHAEDQEERYELVAAELSQFRRTKIELITQTIMHGAYVMRSAAQAVQTSKTFKYTLSNTMDAPDLVEAFIAPRKLIFEASFPSPNTELPPFFPGDCTIVQMKPRATPQ